MKNNKEQPEMTCRVTNKFSGKPLFFNLNILYEFVHNLALYQSQKPRFHCITKCSTSYHGRSQDFFRGGGTLFQKNFHKIFKEF